MTDSFFWRKLLVRTGLARCLPAVVRALAGGEAQLHRYSDRTLAVPLNQLLDHTLLPTVTTPDSINLALGAPRCDLPLGIRHDVSDRRVSSAWGDPQLRTELAEQFQLDHGAEHDPADEVLITHGASGAFAAAIDAFINPGDRVVLFDPASPMFRIGLLHRRASVRWVPTWSDEGRCRFAMDGLTRAMRGAKLLVLADPVNPSGCVYAPEDLEQIAFWARKNDTLIVQDASFDRWRAQPARARIASLPHAEGRVVTCGSFAKSHGLSTIRVGWLIGCRHLVRPCALAAMLSAPFVPSMCQQIAFHALRSAEGSMTTMRADLDRRRGYVQERLRDVGLEPWPAAGGFFVWVPVKGETGEEFAQRLLTQTGVLVNPGKPFGPSGRQFIRISYATDEGRLREGLNRLEGFLVSNAAGGVPAAQAA